MAGAGTTVTAMGLGGPSAPHAFQTNGLTHPLQARGSLQVEGALPKSKQERSGSTERSGAADFLNTLWGHIGRPPGLSATLPGRLCTKSQAPGRAGKEEAVFDLNSPTLHMCLCICMYSYAYMCVSLCVRTCVCMHVCDICIQVCGYIVHMYVCVHMCGCMFVCVCVCICTFGHFLQKVRDN